MWSKSVSPDQNMYLLAGLDVTREKEIKASERNNGKSGGLEQVSDVAR